MSRVCSRPVLVVVAMFVCFGNLATVFAQEVSKGEAFFPVLEPPVVAQNFTAYAPGTTTPPDTNGAVGPNHLLLATNGIVRIQDRSGTVLSTTTLLSFWSGMGVTDAFDPRSFFDPHSQRFIMITCAQRRSATSGMLLAVSATDDPTGVWHRWLLDADPSDVDWVDFGSLGFTNNEITICANMFSVAADAFRGVQIWRINKSTALSGGPLTLESLRALGVGGTLVPVVTFDAFETTQYLIRTGTSNLFGLGRLQLFSLDGPLGTSVLTVASMPAVGSAWSLALQDAPQLGSSARIETNDDRILSAVYQDGRIWCAHNVASPAVSPTRTTVKWWEIFPSTGGSRQDGLIDSPVDRFYYYPSLVVNDQGLMMLGCSGSSTSEYVGCFYAWRNPDSPLGALEGVQSYRSGLGPYSGPRWGDYSGVYLDPVDGTSVWVLQQYAELSNRWGIQWAQLTINQLTVLPVGIVGAVAAAVCVLISGIWIRRRMVREAEVAAE